MRSIQWSSDAAKQRLPPTGCDGIVGASPLFLREKSAIGLHNLPSSTCIYMDGAIRGSGTILGIYASVECNKTNKIVQNELGKSWLIHLYHLRNNPVNNYNQSMR